MKYTDYIPNIKAMLDVREVFEYYGIQVDRKGFASCPFHSERTASCKVYKDGFKCFGCGEHGDVIDFMQKYFNFGKYDACKRLNDDFGLHIPFERESLPFDQYKAQMRVDQARMKKSKIDKLYKEYWMAHDKCMFYRDYIQLHKPKDNEEPTKEFLEALKRLGPCEYLLDVAEVELLNAFVTG